MRRLKCLLFAAVPAFLALETHGQEGPAVAPGSAMADEADKRPFPNDPNGDGLSVEGIGDALRAGTTLTITFPADMVPPDKIDAAGVESPVEAWPSLDADFIWRSQSQGELTVKGPLIPGQSYRFRVSEGEKDLAGNPLQADAWGFEMTAPALRVIEEGYGERTSLNASPQVPIEFNYPIRLSDAARGVWFQDRASRQKYPAEILLNVPEGETDNAPIVEAAAETEEVTAFRVRPLQPLPVGRRYDLIVDGVCDVHGGRALSYPQVFPLGITRPLKIDYVAARNFPLGTPHIEVKFNQALSNVTLPKDPLTITPTVSNLRIRTEGPSLIAEGDFDPSARYVVAVSDEIIGTGGYGLPQPETWGASFRLKDGAILFPDRQVRQRSVLGLNFAFYHVNTAELEWKLAVVPLEKLPSVLSRERDFTRILRDAEGGPLWTRQGTFQRATSEPLISALGLEVLA